MNTRRNPRLARVLVLVLACSLALTFALGSAPSAHANATVLGGLDLKAYCQSQGYIGARSIENTAYGWRCVDRNGNNVLLSLHSACQWQYHTANAWDRIGFFHSAQGIECMSGRFIGGLDLRGYCRFKGEVGAVLQGKTVDDWRCYSYVPFGGGVITHTIWMDDACNWEYGNTYGFVLSRYDNYYSATTMECIG